MSYLYLTEIVGLVAQINTVVTAITNALLIYLTIYQVTKISWAYRMLIIFQAEIGVIFSLIESYGHPFIHSYNASFIYFVLSTTSSKLWRTVLAVAFSTLYQIIFCFMAIQFIYRCVVINASAEKLKWFKGWRVLYWVGLVLGISIIWILLVFLCLPDPYSKKYVQEEMKENYGTPIEDVTGFFILVYEPRTNLQTWNMCGLFFIIGLTSILFSYYIVILCCSLQIHSKINELASMTSLNTHRLQSQLFFTLVLQIAAPSIFHHIPAFALYYAPFLNLKMSFPSGIIVALFSVYPAVDSWILMCVVSEYREAIRNDKTVDTENKVIRNELKKKSILSSSTVPEVPTLTITNECWTEISHRLDKRALLSFILTCRRFYQLTNTDAFWVGRANYENNERVLPSLEWRRAVSQKKLKGDLKFDFKNMVLSGRGYSPIVPDFEKYTSPPDYEGERFLERVRNNNVRVSAKLRVEAPGNGCNPHPDVKQCIAFTYFSTKIHVYIDLVASGIDPWMMDHVRPRIVITQKFNQRRDSGAKLLFSAGLDCEKQDIVRRVVGRQNKVKKMWEQWGPAEWEDMKIELEGYGSGLRYLTICNQDQDTQFWKGYFGPKIANLKIQVILPEVPVIKALDVRDDQNNGSEDEEEQLRAALERLENLKELNDNVDFLTIVIMIPLIVIHFNKFLFIFFILNLRELVLYSLPLELPQIMNLFYLHIYNIKMSSTTSSTNSSNPKTKRNKEPSSSNLHHSASDATLNNERMFGSLEELMTYIGSSYPHYRKTVLPLIIVSAFLFLASRYLQTVEKVKTLKFAENPSGTVFFYSKCQMNRLDDSLKVAETASFLTTNVPKMELTIVMNAIMMFSTTTISPRKLALFSLAVISVCYFAMAHFESQIQMSIYISQIFTEIFRIVALVNIAESVPKYHRMPALVLNELGPTIARGIVNLLARLPADVPKMDVSHSFEFFGFVTICMGFLTYYTFHDSLYSLLARSKTDKMQERLTEIFEKSGIILAPDAVIDQIAFEHFENNENPIEILTRTLKTFKCVQEILVCGIISGVCLTINGFVESQIVAHGDVMFFEKMLIPVACYTLSSILLIGISLWLPKHRILPVILVIPVLFLATSAMEIISRSSKVYSGCHHHYLVNATIFPYYMGLGIFISSLSDMIRFFLRVHLMEVMPVLIRAPIIAVLHFLQYSFDGNVRDTYVMESLDATWVIVLISVLAMLVILITPRKKNDMNVYFLEYTRDDQKRSLPPAPHFVSADQGLTSRKPSEE